MRHKKIVFIPAIIIAGLFLVSFGLNNMNDIPILWEISKLKSAHLPLVNKSIEVHPIAEDIYKKIPERTAYKTYPFYMPGREPKGYYEWLLKQEPELVFDVAKLKTEEDWIKAGELIYEMPQNFDRFIDSAVNMEELQGMAAFMTSIHMPVSKDGTIPFFQIVVRKKGKIEVGTFACGNCHNKVMPDGSVVKGAQGNYPFDKIFGGGLLANIQESKMADSAASVMLSQSFRGLFGAPWIEHESQEFVKKPEYKRAIAVLLATVPGVMHRHSSTLGAPTAIPDLFNLKERKYLDRTGMLLHRDIGDLMRYAVLNQEMDFTNSYGGFKPDTRPDSVLLKRYTRFSDAQAYALSKYIYSLRPLPNPDKAPAELIAKGKAIFEQDVCIDCHTPPLYTNNKLTPVLGFVPSKEDKTRFDISDICVETDPTLALYSRRGTGYYKVPSLIGVWNRQALMHSGYVTSLEEMFNPARQKDDFIPSGFNPNAGQPFAVKGHSFGLDLNVEDKKALLAFLRSL
ncbi:hypothetical protein [Lacibacter sediminis]|uniref:Cytochrome c domain-containing protein n=1 Tax=Lacibacter sediminis TaxID=2760713 RepID=A0A7G5XEK8_9BACT|nr:hypothetical protein [Lacibacter sediminis]QNA43911.1 hypothetical protein H4075_17820 [Lacibacter sediminis]